MPLTMEEMKNMRWMHEWISNPPRFRLKMQMEPRMADGFWRFRPTYITPDVWVGVNEQGMCDPGSMSRGPGIAIRTGYSEYAHHPDRILWLNNDAIYGRHGHSTCYVKDEPTFRLYGRMVLWLNQKFSNNTLDIHDVWDAWPWETLE